MKNTSVLVFSIALNGYQWCYRDCLRSHAAFAKRHGYHYLTVSRPVLTKVGVECCWLKLTLMLKALESGYDTVMFIDADAQVWSRAPHIEQVFYDNKQLFMAKGYSGRFNSGVLIARNGQQVKNWLTAVIAARHLRVSEANSVGWGENGHIIEYATNQGFIGELDLKWNNTFNPNEQDYIRHFSHGPMRNAASIRLYHKALSRLTTLMSKWRGNRSNSDTDLLNTLTEKVLRLYPVFLTQE